MRRPKKVAAAPWSFERRRMGPSGKCRRHVVGEGRRSPPSLAIYSTRCLRRVACNDVFRGGVHVESVFLSWWEEINQGMQRATACRYSAVYAEQPSRKGKRLGLPASRPPGEIYPKTRGEQTMQSASTISTERARRSSLATAVLPFLSFVHRSSSATRSPIRLKRH